MNPRNDIILDAINQKYSIIPIGADKTPCFNWMDYTKRVANIDEIRTWPYITTISAFALVCGKVSGLFTLDFDNKDTINKFQVRPHTITPSGGMHVYVKLPQGDEIPKISQINPWLRENYPELDIQGERSYAIFVGKVKTGIYQNCRPLADLALFEDLPSDLQDFILSTREKAKSQAATQPQPSNLNGEITDVDLSEWVFKAICRVATEGNRDNTCFWLCCQLRDLLYNHGITNGEAKKIIAAQLEEFVAGCPQVNSKGVRDPFTIGQALRKLESVYTKSARELSNEQAAAM